MENIFNLHPIQFKYFTQIQLSDEKWMIIPGYDNRYLISNKARIFSISYGDILKGRNSSYRLLKPNGVRTTYNINELMNLTWFKEA